MAILRLPEPAKIAIQKLARLEDSAIQELNEFIGAHLEGLLSPDEALLKSSKLKLVAQAEAFEILNAIVPFIFNRIGAVTDVASEVNDLVRAVGGQVTADKWTKADDKRLRAKLGLLLENPKTRLKAKSIRLMTTHEKQFDECEVLSDIRPVFSADGKLTAEAGVICHTLKISYMDSESREFYVALNDKDLRKLKKAVDRALDKDGLLAKVISKAGMEHVQLT